MKETTNLKLKKYDYTDTVDMSTGHNLNMDKLDTEVQNLKTTLGSGLNASNISIADTTNVFTATNVENALLENKTSILLHSTEIEDLKLNASNGKNIVATAVGSPLLATDTFATIGTKIDTLTNTLKTNLTAKGVTVVTGDKMSILIDKIPSIQLGKKVVTGTSPNFTLNKTILSSAITLNLDFVPSEVIVYAQAYSSYGSSNFVSLMSSKQTNISTGATFAGIPANKLYLTNPSNNSIIYNMDLNGGDTYSISFSKIYWIAIQ